MKSKFKKNLIVSGVLLIIITGFILRSEMSRKYYCLSENKCVTVWKRSDGYCYIIPGKYKSWMRPKSNYIRTTNIQYLTLYFSNKIPKKIIVRNQGSSSGEKGKYKIVNNLKGNLEIVEYSERYRKFLYKPEAIKFKDVKATTEYISLDIKENYAIDNRGNKLGEK